MCVGIAKSQTPIITMTTAKPIGSVISFKIGSIYNDMPVQIDFGNGALMEYIINTGDNPITGILEGSHTIKFYSENISRLVCNSLQLVALDVTKNLELTNLACYDNLLTSLNVSKNTALRGLNCNYNQIASLDLSKNTNLFNLDCDCNYLTSINLKNNSLLVYVCCRNNQLSAFNCTSNTELSGICISNNFISSIDISKNTKLRDLSCSNNRLTSINTSKNASLRTLYCYNNKITSLNLSNNKQLTWVFCSNNQLKSLDISSNVILHQLKCDNNHLSVLNASYSPYLDTLIINNNMLTSLIIRNSMPPSKLFCHNNNLTFSSLPLPVTPIELYEYIPQKSISIPKISESVDLSSQYLINGNTTVYTWKTKSGAILQQNVDYTISNGITSFKRTISDSVYCEMTNATFPKFIGENVLKTKCTKAIFLGPMMSVTTTMAVGSLFKYKLKANTANTQVAVDYGDGSKVYHTISTSLTDVKGVLKGSIVKIYGFGINTLYTYNCQITAINVMENTDLTTLDCRVNKLTSIDVSQNVKLYQIRCSENLLTSLNFTSNAELVAVECYLNKLNSINVSNNAKLVTLKCYNNNLKSLDISKNPMLRKLYCYSNNLTFATLPPRRSSIYIYEYVPQNAVFVKNINNCIDLSYLYNINGNITTYTWKSISGIILEEGNHYTISNGITQFLYGYPEIIYCEMTNAAFPNLTGENALRTVGIFPEQDDSGISMKAATDISTDVVSLDKIKVYATSKIINIDSPFDAQIYIYDINGRLVFNQLIYEGLTNVELQNPGLYIVRIINDKTQQPQKVVIK